MKEIVLGITGMTCGSSSLIDAVTAAGYGASVAYATKAHEGPES